MGAGASTPRKGNSSKYEANEVSDAHKRLIFKEIDAMLASNVSDEELCQHIRNFKVSDLPSYISPEGPPQLLSVSIFHRHGSRGPGDSELKLWTNRQHPIVKQWASHEYEQLTENGHILLNSLGKWFSEKYLMTSNDDNNSRPKNSMYNKLYPNVSTNIDEANGKNRNIYETKINHDHMNYKSSIWRSSSSNRALSSGNDFTKSIIYHYNHPLQIKPVHKIMPDKPISHEDVEGENREDDHGMDHYFRSWNIKTVKTYLTDYKNNIKGNIIWITKAKKHEIFLRQLYKELGVDKSLLNDITKMLWCVTYVMQLYEIESFWTNDDVVIETTGKHNALLEILNKINITPTDDTLTHTFTANDNDNDYYVDSDGDKDGDANAKSSANANVSANTKMKTKSNSSSCFDELHHLACWVWEQRFVYQPTNISKLGSRITFDILQQLLFTNYSVINVYSGHDYTMLCILSSLNIIQSQGGLKKAIQYGAYLTFELWSKQPPPHFTELNNINNKNNKKGSKKSKKKSTINASGDGADGADGTATSASGGDTVVDAPPPPVASTSASTIVGTSTSDTAKKRNIVYEQCYSNGVYNKVSDQSINAPPGSGKNVHKADERILRIILNENPFVSSEQIKIRKLLNKNKNSRDKRILESHIYSWPVHEEKERIILQINMSQLKNILDILYLSMLGNNIHKPYIHDNHTFHEFIKENF